MLSEEPDKKEEAQEQTDNAAQENENQEAPAAKRADDFGLGKKIMLVDDDPTSLELVRNILTKACFEVIAAKNAEDAWEKLTPETKPNVIITDVLMPGMAGLGLVKELQKNDETFSIPVLVISERKKMADSFLALDVDGFIPKPLDTEKFLDMIDKLCKLPPKKKKKDEPKEEAKEEEQKEEKKEEKDEKKDEKKE